MNFNSTQYLLFLPTCVVLYYLIKPKFKNAYLLIASYLFYMQWEARYALLLLASTCISYTCALCVERSRHEFVRKIWLICAILPNFAILFTFKYLNLSLDFYEKVTHNHLDSLDLLLPVGISFYIFQAIGYSIDVYRKTLSENGGGKKHCAEHNFIDYALFVSFFPQLVAGPIERSDNLLPQFKERICFSQDNIVQGCRLILVGMYKKIVIADMLAILVDGVWKDYQSLGSMTLICAAFAFSMQIYCDFSGYSDIARGSARLLGINLMVNFNAPYMSSSFKEFWNRWHISLSGWFRDYLYIPLGGSRKGYVRKLINLFIVFIVSGIWHGAAYTYIVWGFIHGVFRVAEDVCNSCKKWFNGKRIAIDSKLIIAKTIGIMKTLMVFVVVTIAWIFFRAGRIGDAKSFIAQCVKWNSSDSSACEEICSIVNRSLPIKENGILIWTVIVISSVIILAIVDYLKKNRRYTEEMILARRPLIVRWGLYYLMSISCIYCYLLETNAYGQAGAFLYFQF